ncbi:hypothetical protein ACIRPK_05075 [Kitasatospora sp. NPDC101801]|uniref:hypothetical protein n=1 Tax=Kitasatospora sp. NPDC101801 TaxID=3364103 RepID=UPI0038022B29
MSDFQEGTWIGHASGQTHTGSGAQYTNNYYFAPGGVRSGPDPLRMAIDRRQWLKQRFVAPPGYGGAAKRLENPGTAVLVWGAPGSGRRAAAVMLLHGMGEFDDPFREVVPDEKPEDEPAELADGERVLIDLSNSSELEFVAAQALVKSYWEKTERIGGRLAVVLSQEREQLLEPDFRQLLVRIGRPDGAEVLARHLRPDGIEVPLPELRASALGDSLEHSPMRELQRLSELIIEARAQGGSFDTWARKAADALRDRGPQVAQQMAALTDGRQKALLFAAAMLDGAPADVVFRLSDQLLANLDHPDDELPRLNRVDMAQRLRELTLEVNQGRIRFELLAYGSAVRSHFWLYYPDLRPSFGTWVTETVKETPALESATRRDLVGRFTEQALRSNDVQVLTDLVELWTPETRILPDAMAILDQGLRDEQMGAAFRAKIYAWSTTSQLEPNLVRGLAHICVDVMGPDHPDQALVRLHHLARRESAGLPRYARDYLLELVRRDRRLYERLLGRLREGMERSKPWQRDAEIFLELVIRFPALDGHEDVLRGWRGVLTVAPPATWAPGVKAWLSAARSEQDGGDRLMEILIEAADGGPGVLSRYYLLAYEWAAESSDEPGPVSPDEVAARFCREIDRAQGIEPLDLASAGATEGRGR